MMRLVGRLVKFPKRAINLPRPNVGYKLGQRLYSDKKYNSIEEFNKQKTEYDFNQRFSKVPNRSSNDYQSKVLESLEEQEQLNINDLLEKDPRLSQVEPGSPEYKELLHQINEEFRRSQEKQGKAYERNQRLKAIGIGLIGAVGITMIHQLLFNWEWYKLWFFKSWYDVDEDKLKLKKNSKDFSLLKTKLQEIIKGDFITNLLDSETNTGLYIFGNQNHQKLPTRLPFFNHKLIKDVEIDNELLVVIDDKGKLYQTYKNTDPQLIKLPFKVKKCQISPNYIYLLTDNGELSITPRIDKSIDFEHQTSRSWLGFAQSFDNQYISFKNDADNTNMLSRGEKINDISSGVNHLLMLTSKGRIFTMKTNDLGENFGQFGIPEYSPINNAKIPINKPFELTLLNFEIKVTKSKKSIEPRFFTNIAAGNYHNIVADSNGNIWTWGKNAYGQCGKNVSYKTSIQAVPERAFDLDDFTYICKKQFPKIRSENFSIENVFANAESSFIKLNYKNGQSVEDLLLSFGNGVKGQLGINRYLHVSNNPTIIKSIINEEFNEDLNEVEKIGIQSVSCGKNHSIITLNNSTKGKDILVFGDNEFGQLGNGKLVKNSKPNTLPKIIEPNDIELNDNKKISDRGLSKLTKQINNPDNRLQVTNLKINHSNVEQVVKACDDSSVIFYRRI